MSNHILQKAPPTGLTISVWLVRIPLLLFVLASVGMAVLAVIANRDTIAWAVLCVAGVLAFSSMVLLVVGHIQRTERSQEMLWSALCAIHEELRKPTPSQPTAAVAILNPPWLPRVNPLTPEWVAAAIRQMQERRSAPDYADRRKAITAAIRATPASGTRDDYRRVVAELVREGALTQVQGDALVSSVVVG